MVVECYILKETYVKIICFHYMLHVDFVLKRNMVK